MNSNHSVKTFKEIDNPGGGNCAFYSFAIGIILQLQKQHDLNKASRLQKKRILVELVKAAKQKKLNLEEQIENFDLNNPSASGELLSELNAIFRTLLVKMRITELKTVMQNDPTANFDYNDLIKIILYFYADEAIDQNDPVENLDFYCDPTLREALHSFAGSIKEKEQISQDITVENFSETILLSTYLSLLKKGVIDSPELITLKIEGATLNKNGIAIWQEILDNKDVHEKEQEKSEVNKFKFDDDVLMDLINYLINQERIKNENIKFISANKEAIAEIFQAYYNSTALPENNKFFKNKLLHEIIAIINEFKQFMFFITQKPQIKIPSLMIQKSKKISADKQPILNFMPTKKCITELNERLIATIENEDNPLHQCIAKKLGTNWGTESDIIILAKHFKITPIFYINGVAVQPQPDNHSLVIHLNNINNTHWTTLFDIFPRQVSAKQLDKKISHFKDKKYIKSVDLTTTEILAVFQGYIRGNYSFFCFNSRHHLDLAQEILDKFKNEETDVTTILEFINQKTKGRTFNPHGNFATCLNYLSLRNNGELYKFENKNENSSFNHPQLSEK